jgi:hypothetical protein
MLVRVLCLNIYFICIRIFISITLDERRVLKEAGVLSFKLLQIPGGSKENHRHFKSG